MHQPLRFDTGHIEYHESMSSPQGFAQLVQPPPPLSDNQFRLEPLGPIHNERDHVAWMTSIDHIHGTPGFAAGDWKGDKWPYEMSLDDNLVDLVRHFDEFQTGAAFAYSVLDPNDQVIGCVYIEPDPSGHSESMCRSWVRVSHAALDEVLHQAIVGWLASTHWPLSTTRFPGRPSTVPEGTTSA